MRLFLSRICQNVSCDDCRYRKKPRIADITQGDYWRVSKYLPEMNDNKGTSVVLLVGGNPCIVRSSKPHPKRAEFFANLDKYSLDQLIKMYCPFPSPLKRVYIRMRGLLGRMGKLTPQKIPAKNGADLLTTALRLCIFDSEQMCR